MENRTIDTKYSIRVQDLNGGKRDLAFIFDPKPSVISPPEGELPRRPPQYMVVARMGEGDPSFDWQASPDDPGPLRAELEAEATTRLHARRDWISSVGGLIEQVRTWAQELGWATRVIETKLDDHEIGRHRLPALLMQEETIRILLEPIGRSGTGIDGVVDLYHMPAYDDIARLTFHDGCWHLHYEFHKELIIGVDSDVSGTPLTREVFASVLREMRTHAESV